MRLTFPASSYTGLRNFCYQATLACLPTLVDIIARGFLARHVRYSDLPKATAPFVVLSAMTLIRNPWALCGSLLINVAYKRFFIPPGSRPRIRPLHQHPTKPWSRTNVTVIVNLLLPILAKKPAAVLEFYRATQVDLPRWFQSVDRFQAVNPGIDLTTYGTSLIPDSLTAEEAAVVFKVLLQRFNKPLLHDQSQALLELAGGSIEPVQEWFKTFDPERRTLLKLVIDYFHAVSLVEPERNSSMRLAVTFTPILFGIQRTTHEATSNQRLLTTTLEFLIHRAKEFS